MAILETYENIEMAVRPARIVIEVDWDAEKVIDSKITFRSIRQSVETGEIVNPRAVGFSFGGDKIDPTDFATVFQIFSKYHDAYLRKEPPFEEETTTQQGEP